MKKLALCCPLNSIGATGPWSAPCPKLTRGPSGPQAGPAWVSIISVFPAFTHGAMTEAAVGRKNIY